MWPDNIAVIQAVEVGEEVDELRVAGKGRGVLRRHVEFDAIARGQQDRFRPGIRRAQARAALPRSGRV